MKARAVRSAEGWRLDGRKEIAVLKAHAAEMAWRTENRAMQGSGVTGMTRELPCSS